MKEKYQMMMLAEKNQIAQLIKTNQYTQKFGLVLTEEEAGWLVKARAVSLKEQQRIEFGAGILEKLIFAFCDSVYINQEEYAQTLQRLQEIFYLYKNESLDELTDDELLGFMKEAFENECYGSLEYLEGTCLEAFAREMRAGTNKFFGRNKEDER